MGTLAKEIIKEANDATGTTNGSTREYQRKVERSADEFEEILETEKYTKGDQESFQERRRKKREEESIAKEEQERREANNEENSSYLKASENWTGNGYGNLAAERLMPDIMKFILDRKHENDTNNMINMRKQEENNARTTNDGTHVGKVRAYEQDDTNGGWLAKEIKKERANDNRETMGNNSNVENTDIYANDNFIESSKTDKGNNER